MGGVNNRPWHPDNIRFLQSVLIPGEIISGIDRCHLRLTRPKDREIAARMQADFASQRTLLEIRIEQLPAILSTADHGLSQWTI